MKESKVQQQHSLNLSSAKIDNASVEILKQKTPAMARYAEIKAINPGFLLFYRMGDFFELFFEDAVLASQALDIALTKRGEYQGKPIPMCGVPVRRADEYLRRLIEKNFKVAVCDQMETLEQARKRGPKEAVKRDVVRLVTPGTITEDTLLKARHNNYLAALYQSSDAEEKEFALAWLDISTGEFFSETAKCSHMLTELARLQPSEIVVAEKFAQQEQELCKIFEQQEIYVTKESNSYFDSIKAQQKLQEYFATLSLKAFGSFARSELAAMGALFNYVLKTQISAMPILQAPVKIHENEFMLIDKATRRNLELMQTIDGKNKGSLLHCIDETLTAVGARMLANWMASPVTSIEKINKRLDSAEYFFDDEKNCELLRNILRQCPDLPRAISRLNLNRGSPKDLLNVARALEVFEKITEIFASNENKQTSIKKFPDDLNIAIKQLSLDDSKKKIVELKNDLQMALKQELPAHIRDGGFIRTEYSEELGELIKLRDQSRRVISALESRYANQTNIKNLKIKHNNVLGYFIEVREQSAQKMLEKPLSELFIRRQTLVNNMRFTTVELAELENKINSSAFRIIALEKEFFEEFVERIREQAEHLHKMASCLAYTDVTSSFAKTARQRNFCRPKIVEQPYYQIKGGRHPVIEQAVKADDVLEFIENDCVMTGGDDSEQNANLWILTGPNMAGKSTFLRQNAIIVIMAQIGSFVPANEAVIGVVDRLFSRVGASDNLARGESTFMVEMTETAAILNQASEKSFVILDEIGRGTATFDGMAIAWAVIEHLYDKIKSRSIIATHFHELAALTHNRPDIFLASMRVVEWEKGLQFLHQVIKGTADRSYGIQVAKLAGVPKAVSQRAEQILQTLELNRNYGDITGIAQLNMVAKKKKNKTQQNRLKQQKQELTKQELTKQELTMIEKKLAELKPDEITPRDALEVLYECVRQARKKAETINKNQT